MLVSGAPTVASWPRSGRFCPLGSNL